MFELLKFHPKGDAKGKLIALEKLDLPFKVKRVYYIWDTAPNITRGKHAHLKLEQLIVCISGSCDFILDNGKSKFTVKLDSPEQGLYIKNNIWREFNNFSKNCILMVLASEEYNENDYIRNYSTFKELIAHNV